jgi:5-methylcytosine-specific restriction endonuclease McrA
MKRLKLPVVGKILKRADALECVWCLYGRDPDPKHICGSCHTTFKQKLNCSGWRRLCRAFKLDKDTCYCVDCLAAGFYTPVLVVDHILPWSLRPSLFWEPTNLQGLCQTHHNRKTRTDGSASLRHYGND